MTVHCTTLTPSTSAEVFSGLQLIDGRQVLTKVKQVELRLVVLLPLWAEVRHRFLTKHGNVCDTCCLQSSVFRSNH